MVDDADRTVIVAQRRSATASANRLLTGAVEQPQPPNSRNPIVNGFDLG
jgi:hypothetical protein